MSIRQFVLESLRIPSNFSAMTNTPEMKIVGRRLKSRGGLSAANGFLKLVVTLRQGKPFVPKGVYRFHSQEELDAWTLKMITR